MDRIIIKKTKSRPEQSNLNQLIKCYKGSARKRGLVFGLNREEFGVITKKNCFYCLTPPSQEYRHRTAKDSPYVYNGIDRMDNSMGYTVKNCVPCCGTCNWIKGSMGSEEFISHAKKISLAHK